MDILDEFGFILSGFAVVMGALTMLWLVSASMGRLFTVINRASVAKPAAAAPAPVAQPGFATGIPAGHIAAITAAVAVLTSGRGRVVQVRAPAHVSAVWAQSGRTEQFSSHRVRWDWAIPGPPHVEQDVAAVGTSQPPLPPAKKRT